MMNESLSIKMTTFAPTVVRIGLALVFLWFGSQQILEAGAWAGLIPVQIIEISGMSAVSFVYINGAFEIIFGGCLLLGLFTRVSALLLAIHLLGIVFTIGYNDVGVRDFGLTMAALSVFFYGADSWSLDKFLEKRKLKPDQNY